LRAAEAAHLNEIYLKYTSTGRPFIHVICGLAHGTAQFGGEERKSPQGLPPEWRPSEGLRQLARRYDALVLGDTAAANVAIAAVYIEFARHRVPVIAGDAASVAHLRRAIHIGEPAKVSFAVWAELSGPESSSKKLAGSEPSDDDPGKGASLDRLRAGLSSGHLVTSVLVLSSKIGLDATSGHADKVTFVVDPREVKDPEWLDVAGYGGLRLREAERQEANGFIELSGYTVPR
jgi:hypothetical protein